MALRVLNNLPADAWDGKQEEGRGFSKICFIPSLGLSCFGCCGHHFSDKKRMQWFFDENKELLAKYLGEGKTYKDFMWREERVDSCGGCYSLIREDDAQGREQYLCSVHPLRIGGADIRPGYCDHDYLCASAGAVNKMSEEERSLFYLFLKELVDAKEIDSFSYSIINSQETVLIERYDAWKKRRETAVPNN